MVSLNISHNKKRKFVSQLTYKLLWYFPSHLSWLVAESHQLEKCKIRRELYSSPCSKSHAKGRLLVHQGHEGKVYPVAFEYILLSTHTYIDFGAFSFLRTSFAVLYMWAKIWLFLNLTYYMNTWSYHIRMLLLIYHWLLSKITILSSLDCSLSFITLV